MERKIHPAIAIPTSPSKPLHHLYHHHHIIHFDVQKLYLLIVFLSSPFLLPCPLAAEMASFHYLDFKDSSNICFQGNATSKGTGAIQLNVKDLDGSVGLAYYCEPIHLWDPTTNQLANFTTTFTFGVSSIIGTVRGGGVTFFLSEDPTIPQGGRGDYLGLEVGRNDAVPTGRRFIAVEFDSRANNWDPADSPCHVGIDINSLESVKFAKIWDDVFIPGPQGKAHVVYNSISKYLMASLEYNQTLYRLSHMVDLRSELPGRVYVGFSLATDKSQDPKNITSWLFAYSALDTPKEAPQPPYATSSKPNSSDNNPEGTTTKKIGILVAAIVVPFLIILAALILWFFLYKLKRAKDYIEFQRETSLSQNASLKEHEDGCPRHIPYAHLAAATGDFDQSQRLGKGASGEVYRGFLKGLNQEVAVKRIKEYSKHGEKEFVAEITAIGGLQHRNLVKLIGSCHEGEKLLVVYEFMPNGSLDRQLFDNDEVISWPRRHNIAVGLASALQYLHEELDKCIVHRDIKPGNILLDSEFNTKLGDFGLARMANHGSALQSTKMAGTMGYMAPEYFITGKASKETDVYSFGIVALELASGRRALEPEVKGKDALIHWIWELYEKGTIMDAIDKKLGITFDKNEAERLMMVGMWCAHPDANNRPSSRQVISALNFEITLPDFDINPFRTTPLPYTMISGMPSSTISSDDWRNNNGGKSNNSHVTTSMGSSS